MQLLVTWALLVFSLVPAVSFALSSPDTIPGVVTVDAAGVIEIAGMPGVVIVDSRIGTDRVQGYIEGSVSLPNVETNCFTLARILPSRTTPALFYCNGVKCGRSADAILKAKACGYRNLFWFRGGFEEWLAGGYPYLKK